MTREYVVIGPLNTGTNLLEKILERCYGLTILHRDVKHTLRKSTLIYRQDVNPGLIYIVMFKNVYNWIASIQKHHYDIQFSQSALVLDSTDITYREEQFSNIMEIYNKYYGVYLSMHDDHKYNMIFLDYYRLIDGKEGETYLIRKLKEFEEIKANEEEFMRVLNKPSKNHGMSVNNFREALEKREQQHNLFRYEVMAKDLYIFLQNDLYDRIKELCL